MPYDETFSGWAWLWSVLEDGPAVFERRAALVYDISDTPGRKEQKR